MTKHLGTAILPVALGIAAVAMSVAMAWLSFHFVERPFLQRASRVFGRGFVFAASALALATVAGAGWVLQVSEGLPARLPATAISMAAFEDDRNPHRADCFNRLPSDGLCSIGTPLGEDDSVDFLFWGDSHADAFMPGVDRTASLVGQSGVFAGHSGCPPILGIQRKLDGRECTTFNQSVLSWLEDRADAPFVILGARWTLSVEGTRCRGEAGKEVQLEWIGSSATYPDDSDNAAYVEAGLKMTVSKILATGRRVILLGPVPEVGRNVPTASARKALFGWTPPASVTRQEYEARSGKTERILKRVAEVNDGVRYVPSSDLFCDAQICRTTNANGQPLYVDDDHVSMTAALNLLPQKLQDIFEVAQH